MDDHLGRRASRPTVTIVGALIGGLIGVLAGASVIDWIDPRPPDLSMPMLITMAALGGLGWIVGMAFGWTFGRGRPAPSGALV